MSKTEQDHWLDVAVDCHQCTPDVAAKAIIEIGKRDAAIAELVEALEMVRDGNAGCQPGYVNTMTLQRVSNLIAKHKAKP